MNGHIRFCNAKFTEKGSQRDGAFLNFIDQALQSGGQMKRDLAPGTVWATAKDDHDGQGSVRVQGQGSQQVLLVEAIRFPHIPFGPITIYCTPDIASGRKSDLKGDMCWKILFLYRADEEAYGPGRYRDDVIPGSVEQGPDQASAFEPKRRGKPISAIDASHAGETVALFRAARITNSQSFTAFSAAAFEHLAPVFGCHAGTESVFVRALPPAWLIRTFHYLDACSRFYRAG